MINKFELSMKVYIQQQGKDETSMAWDIKSVQPIKEFKDLPVKVSESIKRQIDALESQLEPKVITKEIVKEIEVVKTPVVKKKKK